MTKKTKRMFIKSIALTAIIAFGIIFCGCENDDVSIKPPNLEDFKVTNPPNQGDDLMGTEVLITSDGDNDADAQNIVNGIPGDTQYQFIEAATNDLDKTVVGNNPQTVDVDKGRDYLPISLMGGGTAKDHVKELKKFWISRIINRNSLVMRT